MRINSLAVVVAVLVVTAGMPGAASAATTLDVTLEQDGATGDGLVVVTTNGTAAENVTVEVGGERAYAGNGTYRTDANGSVVLAQPEDTQNVTVTAVGANATATTTALLQGDDDLTVDATQATDGRVAVVVERNGTAVENATVNVTSENETYAADGDYRTDANGTVELDAPAENVTVTFTAAADGESATETTTLVAVEAPLAVSVEQTTDVTVTVARGDEAVENATVNVTSENYSGAGSYQTGADGTVSLPAPTENVSVTVTATADGDTASETVTLSTEFVEESKNFGQAVKRFVDALRSAGFNGPPGRIISDFVTANNPGNADDAPGQAKKNAVDAADENETAERDDSENRRGPPEHAKEKKNGAKEDRDDRKRPGDDTEDADGEAEAEDEEDEDDENDDDRPDHAKDKGGKKDKK
ncbi:hypothetical protein [Halogeometricum limi]|uniref:Uncharacterized protein n=1 Tax=Halogeometricum limi TaxID=555875 RepID=A0A1I6HTD6_9EURY|nr:hypothetical protein [Halogeometricum limi]SFR57658.1 hypothetical protein SAMN04488124_2422 [Halogeometricum limi]